MCGIAGFYCKNGKWNKDDLLRMTRALNHRGPDAEGFYYNEGIGLGHKRLSIIDLSEQANQPMYSACGKYVIAFNGEVYNFKEIAKELSIPLRTSSDTEVVLESYIKWGEKCLDKFNGMFAFVILNLETRKLFLARDRIGIKPLFYFWDGTHFAFASELKAILKLNIKKTLNKEALADYLFFEYIPKKHSIFKNIFRLENGYYLKLSERLEKLQYYNLLDKYSISKQDFNDETEILKKFDDLLNKSIQYRSISDVPIGAFLSGGTDSSAICAAYQKQNDSSINTFNIGFNIDKYDESAYASKVANVLNTNHTITTADEEEAVRIIDYLVDFYDEPFAAPSTIPSLLVCKKAKEHVTVALSGDGGDELFMGYGYYNWYNRIKKANLFGGKTGSKLAAFLFSFGGNRYKRISRVFNISDASSFWTHIWSQEQYMFNQKEISKLLNQNYHHQTTIDDWDKINTLQIHPFEKISLFDIQHYLSTNLLYKMDIASMASGLEVRVPLIDHNIVEFAINLPLKYKINGSTQKYLLKRYLENHLPNDLIYRTKWGFPAPLENWLSSKLSFLLDKYLNKAKLDEHGLFNYNEVNKMVTDFRNGRRYHFKRIWALIFFQMWFEKYL